MSNPRQCLGSFDKCYSLHLLAAQMSGLLHFLALQVPVPMPGGTLIFRYIPIFFRCATMREAGSQSSVSVHAQKRRIPPFRAHLYREQKREREWRPTREDGGGSQMHHRPVSLDHLARPSTKGWRCPENSVGLPGESIYIFKKGRMENNFLAKR